MRVYLPLIPSHVNLYRLLVQPLAGLDLAAFKMCNFNIWKVGELLYYILAMFFGTSSPLGLHFYHPALGILMTFDVFSRYGVADLLAFSIIAFTARKSRMGGPLPIPTILDAILHDATYYFLLIFTAHLVSLLFVFVAPVGGTQYVPGLSVVLCSSCAYI
jgi:hypothetical protein